MDFLNSTTEVPVWFPVAAILLGAVIGMGGLVAAFRLLGTRESSHAPPSSNGSGAHPVEEPKPKPQPKVQPLSKKEQAAFERLLTRQAEIRATAIHPIAVPKPESSTRTVAVAPEPETDPAVAFQPIKTVGVRCKFCGETDVTQERADSTAKNGRLLRYYKCGKCSRRFVNWVQ